MLRTFSHRLARHKEDLKVGAAVILVPMALALLVSLWKYCLGRIGQESTARIESVDARRLVISFPVPGRMKKLKMKTPFPGLVVGERYELRCNRFVHNDVAVLYWRPVFEPGRFRQIQPLRVTTDALLWNGHVTVTYRVGNSTRTRQLMLPPGFDKRKLPNLRFLYKVKRPQVAYLLAE